MRELIDSLIEQHARSKKITIIEAKREVIAGIKTLLKEKT